MNEKKTPVRDGYVMDSDLTCSMCETRWWRQVMTVNIEELYARPTMADAHEKLSCLRETYIDDGLYKRSNFGTIMRQCQHKLLRQSEPNKQKYV